MYLSESSQLLTDNDIASIKRMDGKYGNFRAVEYRTPKNIDEKWIEVVFSYSPVDRITINALVDVNGEDDDIRIIVRVYNGSRALYERASKGSSLSKYGRLTYVIRSALYDISDLLDRIFSDSYFMCHTSSGQGENLSDYWKLIDEEYLDSQVNRLKKSVDALNSYIDRF